MGNTGRATFLDVAETPRGTGIHREMRLHVDGRAEPVLLHYDIYGGDAGRITSFDGFVQAIIFHAMEAGFPLHVRGEMTDAALYNLDDYQRAWVKWRPERYKLVDIIPDKVISASRLPARQAIVAYSGGVDSNLTLVRNRSRVAKGGYDIRSAVMVQGFDVGYHDDAGLRRLIDRCSPILDAFKVDLKIVRTNSKLLGLQYWPDSHAAELSACLHQFSARYDTAVIGGSAPYEALEIPWGSNPITDHRLSSGFMAAVHDSAGFNRTEKLAVLSHVPHVASCLKVCWEGPFPDRNCGICEKCIRTRLCFMAIGDANPPCFDTPFDPALVRGWRPVEEAFAEISLLIAYARQNGTDGDWTRMAQRQLRKRILRTHLVKLLQAAGLKQPVQQALVSLKALGKPMPAGNAVAPLNPPKREGI